MNVNISIVQAIDLKMNRETLFLLCLSSERGWLRIEVGSCTWNSVGSTIPPTKAYPIQNSETINHTHAQNEKSVELSANVECDVLIGLHATCDLNWYPGTERFVRMEDNVLQSLGTEIMEISSWLWQGWMTNGINVLKFEISGTLKRFICL